MIGNDVWVGSNVTLLNGVKIGDGAIIGAGAVVTKSVPPYAIVSGVPAVVKSMRFPDELIERMLAVQWWKYDAVALSGLPFRRPETALRMLNTRIESGEVKVMPPSFAPLVIARKRKGAVPQIHAARDEASAPTGIE
nr:CatB-related O-acetyltransferase [Rhizobium sp. Root482]